MPRKTKKIKMMVKASPFTEIPSLLIEFFPTKKFTSHHLRRSMKLKQISSKLSSLRLRREAVALAGYQFIRESSMAVVLVGSSLCTN